MKKIKILLTSSVLFIIIGLGGIFLSRHFMFSEDENVALFFICAPVMTVILAGSVIYTVENKDL